LNAASEGVWLEPHTRQIVPGDIEAFHPYVSSFLATYDCYMCAVDKGVELTQQLVELAG
jgi:hypothetical protein